MRMQLRTCLNKHLPCYLLMLHTQTTFWSNSCNQKISNIYFLTWLIKTCFFYFIILLDVGTILWEIRTQNIIVLERLPPFALCQAPTFSLRQQLHIVLPQYTNIYSNISLKQVLWFDILNKIIFPLYWGQRDHFRTLVGE